MLDAEDTKKILAIPLSRYDIHNKLVWHHTKCGIYLTSSGYNNAKDLKKIGELRSKPVGESSKRIGDGNL
ncbi:hypothetical protein LIER_02840 [Lithospermum erythrorhizon]|uniref:Uncharacterized protein n=1 Tax=Lithospermum erythrorhizon TaxID=34254 RepID=A0AAV3NQZ6_LITER